MPPAVEPIIDTLLDVARDLVVQREFDFDVVLSLLSKLPLDDLDLQARGAIKHARITTKTAATEGGSVLTADARFALARVVALLETQVDHG